MSTEHSPLPWLQYGQHVQEGASGHKMNVAWCGSVYGAGIVNGRAESFSTTEKQAEANAAFIVKAVNAHDALVKALTDMVTAHGGLIVSPACKQAVAALALAKGE